MKTKSKWVDVILLLQKTSTKLLNGFLKRRIRMSSHDRESLRHKELKNNPTGNLSDSYNRAKSGNLVGIVNSIGWKGMSITIILAFMVFILISYFSQ
jgi:hypothetical protein